MNAALQRWRDEFAAAPDTAFDRLVLGLVPLGTLAQLSLAELLERFFKPGDATLDAAAHGWLEHHLLAEIPAGTGYQRWVAVLEDFFRAIAGMELPRTNQLLREKHNRLRLWLAGFYQGPDRDPEGAYLQALALAQADQTFSPLWRRLILGEERSGRDYQRLGILGFRKMREADGRPPADVPEGLLQALVELADRPGAAKTRWKITLRALFAAYRRSEAKWVERFAPLLENCAKESHARVWLADLLPGLARKGAGENAARKVKPIPLAVSQGWVSRVKADTAVCDTPEFPAFLDEHRTYAQASGDPEFINKTFNNLAMAMIRGGKPRAAQAVSLMEEALHWAPANPHNWTAYAKTLEKAHCTAEALAALWLARQRFAWNPFIRTELARLLRSSGDLSAAAGVYREAAEHFPADVVCRAGLGDLLIDLDDEDEAERQFNQALALDERNPTARGGLARVWAIRSAKNRDEPLREQARATLQELAHEGEADARRRLPDFDGHWQRALSDPSVKFRRETPPHQTAPHAPRHAEMKPAERLGRAMIALGQAARTSDAATRAGLCTAAKDFLDLPESAIDADLLAAFVETRGLVMLAAGEPRQALDYFDEQVSRYGRGGWIGVYLGRQRARLALGEGGDTEDGGVLAETRSGRFALQVVKVIAKLSAAPPQAEIRDLLLALYPLAAAPVQTSQHGNLTYENGGQMLGAFLQNRWFHPAGIHVIEDFDNPEALQNVVNLVEKSRIDTFDAISNATLALAA